jgi:hypothetical protein
MRRRDFRNILGSAAALAVVGGASPAVPQPASQEQRAVPIPPRTVRVGCCRCVDGISRSITLSTRRAPWTVDGPGAGGPVPVAPANHVAWAPVPPAGWVGPANARHAPPGVYVYELRILVPNCTIAATVSVSGRVAADNNFRLALGGNPPVTCTNNLCFQAGNVQPFGSWTLGPGLHTLRVTVNNSEGPTGMILSGTITAACPRERSPRALEAVPEIPTP